MQGSPQGRSNNSQHLLSASCVQAVPVIPVVPSANLVGAGTLPGRKAPGQVLESGPGPVTKARREHLGWASVWLTNPSALPPGHVVGDISCP